MCTKTVGNCKNIRPNKKKYKQTITLKSKLFFFFF